MRPTSQLAWRSLGTDLPSRRELEEVLERPPDFFSDVDLPEEWALGPVVDTSEATALARANWRALEEALDEHPEWEDQWMLVRAGVGQGAWVEHLSFEAIGDDGAPTEIFEFLTAWFEDLSENTVADDDLYLAMIEEASLQGLSRSLDDLRHRVEGAFGRAPYQSFADFPTDWKAQMATALRDVAAEVDRFDIPYYPEEVLEGVAARLGFAGAQRLGNPCASAPTYLVLQDIETSVFLVGELLEENPTSQRAAVFDESRGRERILRKDARSGLWSVDRSGASYDLISRVTPRSDRSRNANPDETTIGPGFGSWLGWASGSVVATMSGLLMGITFPSSLVFGWTLTTLGAAAGGYLSAAEDRKRRVTAGAAIGNAIFPIIGIGAALGGWIGGKKPDPREVQELRARRRRERERDIKRANRR